MAVRRLAETDLQPRSFAFNRSNTPVVKDWIRKYPEGRQASAVIPLLMIAQEQDGWVTKAAIERVAEMLEMPYIRALEVATFYTQFQLAPVGTRAHIQVCGTTPCMLRGSEALMEVCKRKISPNQFETNSDGTLSWEEVECQGACVNAPMVMIFKDTYEDLTPERLEEIIDAFEAGKGKSVKPGPQNGRTCSEPEGGLTTLNGAEKPKKTIKTATKTAGPARLSKPDGNADDLKLISGVGPKLEKTLNGLGFWHFSQIAKWTNEDIAIVDDELSFKGRIERDDWVKQANALAKGGEK